MSSLTAFLLMMFVLMPDQLASAEARVYSSCEKPHWEAPAESTDGVFTGDLALNCWIDGGSTWNPKVSGLRQKVIDQVRAESKIHDGPISIDASSTPTLKWDASHQFSDDGNSVYIRETILLSTPSDSEIRYETTSKEVVASGMAGYLRSVGFLMEITRKDKRVHIGFRNKVQVQRPWYALDLIFAPIARKVCFDKMEKVKEKFLPWLLSSLSESPVKPTIPESETSRIDTDQ